MTAQGYYTLPLARHYAVTKSASTDSADRQLRQSRQAWHHTNLDIGKTADTASQTLAVAITLWLPIRYSFALSLAHAKSIAAEVWQI